MIKNNYFFYISTKEKIYPTIKATSSSLSKKDRENQFCQ